MVLPFSGLLYKNHPVKHIPIISSPFNSFMGLDDPYIFIGSYQSVCYITLRILFHSYLGVKGVKGGLFQSPKFLIVKTWLIKTFFHGLEVTPIDPLNPLKF
jgi:hypothetical protein